MIPLEGTRCNCPPNVDYGGGSGFERAMECYGDGDSVCGVRLDNEPHGGSSGSSRGTTTSLTTRLRRLPDVTVVQEPPVLMPGLGWWAQGLLTHWVGTSEE